MSDSEETPKPKAAPKPASKSTAKAPPKPAPKSAQASAPLALDLTKQIPTIAIATVCGAALALMVQFLIGMGTGADDGDIQEFFARLQQVEREVAEVAQSASGAEVDGLARSVSDLRSRLARLESRGGSSSNSQQLSANIDGLSRQLTDIQGRTSTLEAITPADLAAQLGAFALASDIDGLAGRVQKLEENELAHDTRRAALALGLAQLARTARGSSPFDAELEALGRLRLEGGLVAELRPLANQGAPTHAMLVADFPQMSRSVIKIASSTGELGAWQRVWAWLSQAFTFRRTGEVEGASVQAVLARAELRLSEDNLDAAIQEMRTLPDASRNEAAEWLGGAERRHQLDQLIAALSITVIEELQQ